MIDTLKDCSLPSPVLWILSILPFISFTLRIYKIGGEGGGRGSDCCRVEVHQGHRNPTHDKQVDDTNYSIDQLTNAWLSKNCGNKSVWCFARFGFRHVIHSWGRVAAVTLITCFSGSNVDWRVYRNVTSPLFLARRSPLSKIGVLEMSYRSRLSN